MSTAGMAAATQYVTFMVGAHRFGIDVLDVQEVLCEQRVSAIPLAPPAVDGLINLRGEIVPAINVRELIGEPSSQPGGSRPGVVVRSSVGTISLQVDSIGDVLDVDGSSFEAAPANLDPTLAAMVRGVHKLPNHLLLVLNVREILRQGGAHQAAETATGPAHTN
jgi:purine-binding chemotaxis protein CheW